MGTRQVNDFRANTTAALVAATLQNIGRFTDGDTATVYDPATDTYNGAYVFVPQSVKDTTSIVNDGDIRVVVQGVGHWRSGKYASILTLIATGLTVLSGTQETIKFTCADASLQGLAGVTKLTTLEADLVAFEQAHPEAAGGVTYNAQQVGNEVVVSITNNTDIDFVMAPAQVGVFASINAATAAAVPAPAGVVGLRSYLDAVGQLFVGWDSGVTPDTSGPSMASVNGTPVVEYSVMQNYPNTQLADALYWVGSGQNTVNTGDVVTVAFNNGERVTVTAGPVDVLTYA